LENLVLEQNSRLGILNWDVLKMTSKNLGIGSYSIDGFQKEILKIRWG
jgi:hypothetical protein